MRQICEVGAPVACPEKPPPAAEATRSGQETEERLFSFMLHFTAEQRIKTQGDLRTLLKPHLPQARFGKTIPLQNGWAARIDAYLPSMEAVKAVPQALASLGSVREVTDKHLESIAPSLTHDRVLNLGLNPKP